MKRIRSIFIFIVVFCLTFTAGTVVSEAAGKGKIGFVSDIVGSPGDTITVTVFIDMTQVTGEWAVNPSIDLEGYGSVFVDHTWEPAGWVQNGNQDRYFHELHLSIAEDAVQGVYNITINREGTEYKINNIGSTSFDIVNKTITVLGYTVTPIADQTLSPLIEGYDSGSQETAPITVTRTGSGKLVNLQAELGGTNENDFIVTELQPSTLNTVGDTTSFTIQAKDGLAPGTYTATVDISADKMAAGATFIVTQVVHQQLEITSHPQHKIAKEGDDVSFGVTAIGGNLTYQWQEDRGEGFTNMAGQHGATLHLPAVTGEMTEWQYRVAVTTGDGQTGTSSAAQLTVKNVPSTPELLEVQELDAKVMLTWTPSSGASIYKVYKSEIAGSYIGVEERTVAADEYEYEWSGLTNGTTYYFKVNAENEVGESESNEKSARPRTVPSAPTDVTATAGNGQATVSFTAPANGESDIINYKVIAMPGNIMITGTESPITVTGLSNGVTYTFTVQAVNSAGNSADSDASNAVTPRKAPDSSYTSPPPSTITKPDPKPIPVTPSPTVDVFKSNIVNEAGLLKTVESKVAEAKEASDIIDFADIQGHWAEKTIAIFNQLQLIKGYEDGTVRPNNSITRAEFAAILHRVFHIDGSSNNSVVLKDIGNNWAKEAIKNLVAAGVIKGYENGMFKPDQWITREEMVVILSRIVNFSNIEKDTKKGNFNDLNGSYAASEIKAAAQAGFVSGKGDGRFDPKSDVTRAEALQIILNVLKLNSQLKTLLDSLI